MRKAVIYARVSSTSDRQSTARQVSDLRAYADREGLEIVKVFQEKGSGAKEDRPVLQVYFLLRGTEYRTSRFRGITIGVVICFQIF